MAEGVALASARSTGVSYQDLLDSDTHPVNPAMRLQNVPEIPVLRVPVERYTSRAFHDLEVEKVWKKVWQFACREEDIPEVGDTWVYDVGELSVLVVRSAPDEILAFHNACLHRGRQLRECPARLPGEIRCPFHGWTWSLDGRLKRIPARWDFPHVDRGDNDLPRLRVGTWCGFVFVNPDPEGESLESFLGELPMHFERWNLADRYKAAHVRKRLACNWKVAQEAFMEAYHVVATHPQLLASIGDTNSQYDAWGNFSRAMTPNGTPSPHLDWEPDQQEQLDVILNRSLDEPQMMHVPEERKAREMAALAMRMQMQRAVPGVHDYSDAEILDSIYYSLFPNFHPWAAFNRVVYRFLPWGGDPDQCTMEVLFLMPFRGRRPSPAPVRELGLDEDWTRAPELGFLSRVFNQDTFNLPKVQRGLHATRAAEIQLAQYQELKLRHFHWLLEKHVQA